MPETPANTDSPADEYHDDRVAIYDDKDGTRLFSLVNGPWLPKYTRLAKQYGVNAISFYGTNDWTDAECSFLRDFPELQSLSAKLPSLWAEHSLGFLDHVPNLTSLILRGGPRVHWEKVESLKRLRLLKAHLYRVNPRPRPLDFTALHELIELQFDWTKSWSSALHARQLRQISIGVAEWGIPERLVHLDCSGLPALVELTLAPCTRLETVTLYPEARVWKVHINNCPTLRLGALLSEHLERLTIIGKIESDWGEIAKAKYLKVLNIWSTRTVKSAQFIKELPHLEVVRIEGNLPDDEKSYIRAINEKTIERLKKEGEKVGSFLF